MAQIISRLFTEEKFARSAYDRFRTEWFPKHAMAIYHKDGPGGDQVEAKLVEAGVNPDTAAAYASHVAKGAAVLVVAATYKPLGAARIARSIMADVDGVDVGDLPEESYMKDRPDPAPSILKDHPQFFTAAPGPFDPPATLVSRAMGLKLLSQQRPRTSAISGGRFMSRAFWPGPLLSNKERKNKVMSDGRRMSRMFWPAPLVTSNPRRLSVIRGGGQPFSRLLGWRTSIQR